MCCCRRVSVRSGPSLPALRTRRKGALPTVPFGQSVRPFGAHHRGLAHPKYVQHVYVHGAVPFGQSVLRSDHVFLPARFRPFGALVIYRHCVHVGETGLFLPSRSGKASVRSGHTTGVWLTRNTYNMSMYTGQSRSDKASYVATMCFCRRVSVRSGPSLYIGIAHT